MPTTEQAIRCYILCQNLTQFYLPIVLIRLDERTNNVYILAGDSLQIEVDQAGEAEFL